MPLILNALVQFVASLLGPLPYKLLLALRAMKCTNSSLSLLGSLRSLPLTAEEGKKLTGLSVKVESLVKSVERLVVSETKAKTKETVRKSKHENFVKLANDFKPADKLNDGKGVKINKKKRKKKNSEVRKNNSWSRVKRR